MASYCAGSMPGPACAFFYFFCKWLSLVLFILFLIFCVKLAPHCRQTVHFQFPFHFFMCHFDLKFIHVLYFFVIFFS